MDPSQQLHSQLVTLLFARIVELAQDFKIALLWLGMMPFSVLNPYENRKMHGGGIPLDERRRDAPWKAYWCKYQCFVLA